jgi:DNA-binding GntR family transcriptional regulator
MMQAKAGNPGNPTDSVVERVYERLKSMTIAYEFKPGERLNEVELSRSLGASRTPLREALNRLSMEGLLRFAPGKGYFCRELDVHEVFCLYELRKAIEVAAVRLAIQRAKAMRRCCACWRTSTRAFASCAGSTWTAVIVRTPRPSIAMYCSA